MAATGSLTWSAVEPQLSDLESAELDLLALVGCFGEAGQVSQERIDAICTTAVRFAAELLDSTVVSGASKSPEFDRLLAAAYQVAAQHLEADKGRFESEGEIDGYETAVTMLEEYRDGAARRGNRMVRS